MALGVSHSEEGTSFQPFSTPATTSCAPTPCDFETDFADFQTAAPAVTTDWSTVVNIATVTSPQRGRRKSRSDGFTRRNVVRPDRLEDVDIGNLPSPTDDDLPPPCQDVTPTSPPCDNRDYVDLDEEDEELRRENNLWSNVASKSGTKGDREREPEKERRREREPETEKERRREREPDTGKERSRDVETGDVTGHNKDPLEDFFAATDDHFCEFVAPRPDSSLPVGTEDEADDFGEFSGIVTTVASTHLESALPRANGAPSRTSSPRPTPAPPTPAHPTPAPPTPAHPTPAPPTPAHPTPHSPTGTTESPPLGDTPTNGSSSSCDLAPLPVEDDFAEWSDVKVGCEPSIADHGGPTNSVRSFDGWESSVEAFAVIPASRSSASLDFKAERGSQNSLDFTVNAEGSTQQS